jgi:hypothetical protein
MAGSTRIPVTKGITVEQAKKMVGPGWASLIQDAYNMFPETAFVTQVKEKFGELSIYVNGLSLREMDKLDAITAKSTRICEVCGAPGNIATIRGWYKTLCYEHQLLSVTAGGVRRGSN